MFTGLIEEVGRVLRIVRVGAGLQRLEVEAEQVMDGLAVGDSVNIDGACQTAVQVDAGRFAVESVAETLKCTTLGLLRVGDRVNLERALRASDRLAGHMVLGHVDGVGHVRRLEQPPGQWTLGVEPPANLQRYVVAKGSIAIDGISLTVAQVLADEVFTVAIIPHTLKHTHLSTIALGDPVNLEVDVVARYVERLLSSDPAAARKGLDLDDMKRLGYS